MPLVSTFIQSCISPELSACNNKLRKGEMTLKQKLRSVSTASAGCVCVCVGGWVRCVCGGGVGCVWVCVVGVGRQWLGHQVYLDTA